MLPLQIFEPHNNKRQWKPFVTRSMITGYDIKHNHDRYSIQTRLWTYKRPKSTLLSEPWSIFISIIVANVIKMFSGIIYALGYECFTVSRIYKTYCNTEWLCIDWTGASWKLRNMSSKLMPWACRLWSSKLAVHERTYYMLDYKH